jgi:hypothetical protein
MTFVSPIHSRDFSNCVCAYINMLQNLHLLNVNLLIFTKDRIDCNKKTKKEVYNFAYFSVC